MLRWRNYFFDIIYSKRNRSISILATRVCTVTSGVYSLGKQGLLSEDVVEENSNI